MYAGFLFLLFFAPFQCSLGGAMQYPVNQGFRFLTNLRIVGSLVSQLKTKFYLFFLWLQLIVTARMDLRETESQPCVLLEIEIGVG